MIARLPPWKNLKRPRLYSYGSSHGFLRGLSNQESLRATKRREREREREREVQLHASFDRYPFLSFSPRVLRDSSRIVGGKFTRVRSERKAVSIFRDKLVTVYRNWKLNRGTYGFFSSLVLFFVTFKEDLLRMFASKLWTYGWNSLKFFWRKIWKRFFFFFVRAKTNFWNQFDSFG